MGKSGTTLGSPCWMAPEVVAARDADGYDNRADIVRNPPPALFRPANWTQMFNDFIAECLTKNPEHRPYMVEILEHPFLTELQQNDYT
ncbi:Neither inactivation nor afterpotential protein C, partial [Gryllus bimaculatus]